MAQCFFNTVRIYARFCPVDLWQGVPRWLMAGFKPLTRVITSMSAYGCLPMRPWRRTGSHRATHRLLRRCRAAPRELPTRHLQHGLVAGQPLLYRAQARYASTLRCSRHSPAHYCAADCMFVVCAGRLSCSRANWSTVCRAVHGLAIGGGGRPYLLSRCALAQAARVQGRAVACTFASACRMRGVGVVCALLTIGRLPHRRRS